MLFFFKKVQKSLRQSTNPHPSFEQRWKKKLYLSTKALDPPPLPTRRKVRYLWSVPTIRDRTLNLNLNL